MISGGVCLLGALPVLLDEWGCRAMWTLVPLPSPGAPVVVDGLISCTSNGRFDSSQRIAWRRRRVLLHLPKDVMVLFVRNRTRKVVVRLEEWELLFHQYPQSHLVSSPPLLFPASTDFPPCRNTLCDYRGLRSKFEGKCVCIVWGYGFFTVIADWLISSFSKVRSGLQVTGFRILHPVPWWLCVLTTWLESIMKSQLDRGRRQLFLTQGIF